MFHDNMTTHWPNSLRRSKAAPKILVDWDLDGWSLGDGVGYCWSQLASQTSTSACVQRATSRKPGFDRAHKFIKCLIVATYGCPILRWPLFEHGQSASGVNGPVVFQ